MQSLWLPAIQAQLALNGVKKESGFRPDCSASCFPNRVGGNSVRRQYFLSLSNLRSWRGISRRRPRDRCRRRVSEDLDHSGIVWNCWTGALARLGVARANALEARTSQGADADLARTRALSAYEDFLTLWKDADPDIPILKEAKAEYAKVEVSQKRLSIKQVLASFWVSGAQICKTSKA